MKKAMGNKFFKRKDPQKAIEEAPAIKLQENQAAFEFDCKAKKMYEKAESTDGQKFVFLSRAVMVKEHIHNFIVLPDPRAFENLQRFYRGMKNLVIGSVI